MSLSSALTIALTGLKASSTAASVIAGNISNSGTTGYTDKGVELTAISSGTSLGGVEVSGYSRVTDSVLSATLNNATTNASYLSTQNSLMSQVQSILDSSDDPPALSSAVSNFQSAWTQYAADPQDATQQQAVISAGEQLASTISGISSQVQTLQTSVQGNLSTTVSSLNTDLAQIQTYNTEIETAQANGQATGDLEDDRDQVVNSIAAITNVQVMSRPNGAIALYTSSGTALIDGQAQVFTATSNTVTNAVGADVTGVLTGGSLQAETNFLSNSTTNTANGVATLSKLSSQLQNYANMFVSTASGGFASAYNSAATQSGEQPDSFFTASTASNGLPDLSTLQVNAALVSGTKTLKQASATPVANTFTATNLAINTATTPATTSSTFTANGLTTNGQTYAQIANSILSGFQQQANAISTASTTAATQQSYYQNALTSETGVNTDTELVNLTNWQNAYAASAHVISTIQSMFTILEQAMTAA